MHVSKFTVLPIGRPTCVTSILYSWINRESYAFGLTTGAASLPADAPTLISVTASSAAIRWKKISSVAVYHAEFYLYAVQYKERSAVDWKTWQTLNDQAPSSAHYQADTLTGLMFNTEYEVQIKSYRAWEGTEEETGRTKTFSFRTKCRGLRWIIVLQIY